MASKTAVYSILGLCLALITSSATAASCDVSGCNGTSGVCHDFPSLESYCACRSGHSDSDCSTNVSDTCTYNTINVTTTDYSPLSVGLFFDADHLNVAIASPLVTERNYTLVAIDNSAFGDENCTYPGPYWSRSFNTCNDIFTGVMPWTDNAECGWTVDNTSPSLAVYSAQMVVEHHDFIDPFGNRNSSAKVERITQHVIPLTVSFPKNITINSDITVQSPVRLLAAVSKQTVSADGTSAVIEIATNLIWPYKLANFAINSNPGTASLYVPTLVSSTCPNSNTVADSCTQIFRIAITNGAACTLNGQYDLEWEITCQQTGGVNPVECATEPGALANAALVVVSEDFCATISTTTPLSGSLSVYSDLAHSNPRAGFLVGQTLFWQVSVISPNVTLTGTTINSVKLTAPGQPDVLLYSNLALGADGTAASFATSSSAVDTADFQFTLTEGLISTLADDSRRSYTTRVIIDVDYQDVVTTKRGRRSVEFSSNLNQQPVALSNSFEASKPASGDASTLSCGLASLFALFLPELAQRLF